jgi:phage baseplate assembly protein W
MDISHLWGADVSLGATGDLAPATGARATEQRLLRRLLTAPGEYLWQPGYGAGLGRFVGQPLAVPAIAAAIRAQILKEPAVAATPEPEIGVRADATGQVFVEIRYVDAPSGATRQLAFTVEG